MAGEHFLIVDEEVEAVALAEDTLHWSGYRTARTTGQDAQAVARRDVPNLILLELRLSEIDGFDVCRQLQADRRTASIPVVLLTARSEEADIVTGLELGADDYVTKPFRPQELAARIRAVLRRVPRTRDQIDLPIRIGELCIDPTSHEARVEGQRIDLTVTEFRILHLLARRAGRVLMRAQIIDEVQGLEASITDRSVDVHIVCIRKKLGPCASRIETVRGMGYRLGDD